MTKRKTTAEFIEEAKAVHGDRYDYSRVEYKGSAISVKIKCKRHGYFMQTPGTHLNSKIGCIECAGKKQKTTESFIKEAKAKYEDRFSYEKTVYVRSTEKVCVTCKKHGDFYIMPSSFFAGQSCRECYRDRQKVNVCGVGINDYDGLIKINNKHIQSYHSWRDMIRRCYDEKHRAKNPTYHDCTVCEEWKYFSNFKEWFDNPKNGYKDGYCLDKDLLCKNNRIYSPDVCCFIPNEINVLITRHKKHRGDCLIGVTYRAKEDKFYSVVQNPFTHKQHFLGVFLNEKDAYIKYKETKEHYIKAMAEKYFAEDRITSVVYEAMCRYEVEEDD